MPFINTKDAGPVALEIPAADDGSITGTVFDCWQAALEDVGPAGVDKGKGGKYLIDPPDFKDKTPDHYIPLRSNNYQNYALLRSILKSGSDADIANAVVYAKRIKVYPCHKQPIPQPRSLLTPSIRSSIRRSRTTYVFSSRSTAWCSMNRGS
jgi:hypothetical protein